MFLTGNAYLRSASTIDLSSSPRSAVLDVEKDSPLPGLLIYAPHLLPAGQQYVREHAARLRRHRPVLAGRRHIDGVSISDFPNFTFPAGAAGRLRELRYLLSGADAALSAFIRHHRIRLIHAHFGPGGTEIMGVAARLGIPLVVTFHGWDVKLNTETNVPMSRYERLYRSRLPRLLTQASKVICVSQAWHDRVLQLGCPPDKVHTNYLGVDSSFFDGKHRSFDPLSILFVGRLIPRKGVLTLLQALHLLRDRGIDAHLTIVGDGPELDSLQRTAQAHDLPVNFLGKRNPAEIRAQLRRTALLCAPSTTAGGHSPEALGLVLLEAQAMGVPVVSTWNGGIPETLIDGVTGFLVEQESPADLAGAMARLLDNENLNRSFGQRGRAFVRERFDIDRCYRALEDIYDQVERA